MKTRISAVAAAVTIAATLGGYAVGHAVNPNGSPGAFCEKVRKMPRGENWRPYYRTYCTKQGTVIILDMKHGEIVDIAKPGYLESADK